MYILFSEGYSRNRLIFCSCCSRAIKIYSRKANISHSEVMYNWALLWPCLELCADMVSESQAVRAVFFPGEGNCAMTTQLRKLGAFDGIKKYNADGVIRFESLSDAEVLLLETSGAYNEGSHRRRSATTFHKTMFGLIAMIKALAESIPRASSATFYAICKHIPRHERVSAWRCLIPLTKVIVIFVQILL